LGVQRVGGRDEGAVDNSGAMRSGPISTGSGAYPPGALLSSGPLMAMGPGAIVEAQPRLGGLWFRGRVARVNGNGTFVVAYDGGITEESVPMQSIRPVGAGPPQPQLAPHPLQLPLPPQQLQAQQGAHPGMMPATNGTAVRAQRSMSWPFGEQAAVRGLPQPYKASPAPPIPEQAPAWKELSLQNGVATPAMVAGAMNGTSQGPRENGLPHPQRRSRGDSLAMCCGTHTGPLEAAQGQQGQQGQGHQDPEESDSSEDMEPSLMGRLRGWTTSFMGSVQDRLERLQVHAMVPVDMPSLQKRCDAHLNDVSIEYPENEVHDATQGFHESRLIGSGAFGSVYRGVMRDGTEVAIKLLKLPDMAGFEDEVRVLSRFRHPNLVILMGFARHPEDGGRSLIYEFLLGGDASRRLTRSRQGLQPFEARARLSVALDAASGLSHLHNAKPHAFHRDIKCANILLDKNGTAKMADFGLACVSPINFQMVGMASGTPGYMCPEYLRSGVVTESSEVYSFGMVLLELLTGVPPAVIRKDKPQELEFLLSKLKGSPAKAVEMCDPTAGFATNLARALADMAFNCVAESGRPQFTRLVDELRRLLHPEDYPVIVVSATAPMATLDALLPRERGVSSISRAFSEALPGRLTCTFAEGLSSAKLAALPERLRNVPLSAEGLELVVGRTRQSPDFWDTLVQEGRRCLVSREHFRIASQAAGDEARRDFRVACLSPNGMLVNGQLLGHDDSDRQLRNGDSIALVSLAEPSGIGGPQSLPPPPRKPFLAFRFDFEAPDREDSEESDAWPPDGASIGYWAPLESLDVPSDAMFALELQGESVQDLPREARRLFLRSSSDDADIRALCVGMHHQRDFWRRSLVSDFWAEGCWNFLAEDHFEVRLSLVPGRAPSPPGRRLTLRVLCRAGVLVNGAACLQGEEVDLHDGDVVTVDTPTGVLSRSSPKGAAKRQLRGLHFIIDSLTSAFHGRQTQSRAGSLALAPAGARNASEKQRPPALQLAGRQPLACAAGVLPLPVDVEVDSP